MTEIAAETAPPKPAKSTPARPKRLSRREPAALQVLATLRERIIKGELAPGQRIVERSLCAEMDVSRTPLREALKLLELDGLVEISQHKGARVVPFTVAEATHLFEVLAGLEGLAAELAVGRMDEAARARLSDLHTRMTGHHGRGERDAYFDVNSQIHDAILEAAGNPVLAATHHGLMLRARRGRYMAIVDPARWQEAFEEHEALMAAIAADDAPAAGRVWRRHLLHTGLAVAGVLRATESDDARRTPARPRGR